MTSRRNRFPDTRLFDSAVASATDRTRRRLARSVILDDFVAVTGYERKYAIRLLLGPVVSQVGGQTY
jgi:hypothetical protein